MPKPRSTSREGLLNAFTELVAEFGYEGASLALLGERVGVVKGTIVHHFGTKDRMLVESHRLYMDRRMAEANAVLAALNDPAEQLVAMVYSNVRAHHDDRTATVSFLREFTRFASHPDGEEVRQIRRDYAAVTTTILQRGLDAGVFASIDVNLTAMQVFGAQNHMWTWYRPDGQFSPEAITAQFVSNLLGGICQPPRRRITAEDVLRVWAPVKAAIELRIAPVAS